MHTTKLRIRDMGLGMEAPHNLRLYHYQRSIILVQPLQRVMEDSPVPKEKKPGKISKALNKFRHKMQINSPPAQMPNQAPSGLEKTDALSAPAPEPVKPVHQTPPPPTPQHTVSAPKITTTATSIATATTQTGADGSTKYYFGTPVHGRTISSPPGYTTPGYEWATRAKGYDWDSRAKIYGGNVPLGEAYERNMKQRQEAVESNYRKMEKQREDSIKVKNTGVRTMVASGYNAGMEA